ncbi:uncharacterized protein MELLADRAFT_102668 [Melampsora larici-populina 98AG31]|uniref:Uncharacterized protein n=1 Tax=Melampsora larici-populina (strain 98AG31 / pathotype 3-4-7) TaxID=747676 RepID=F4R905_MELLP|nr:uncharacterized protein MELLADRAFT_102668 [Melampsora larici-populina 98AG31]EGG11239.1 hypothetical protein MELLADRAFT_102668 [Melampsora larici-populina 98AG31]
MMDVGEKLQASQINLIEDQEEIPTFTGIFEPRFDDNYTEDDGQHNNRPRRAPTPNTFEDITPISPHASQNPTAEPASAISTSAISTIKKPARYLSNTHPARRTKKSSNASRVNALTDQERALDSSSDDDAVTTTTAVTQVPSGRALYQSITY